MFLTFQEVQDSDIQNVVSESPTSPDFKQHLMSAIERLIRRGDWAGTVVPLHTCVLRGCVVWPRYVDHVRYVSDCCGNIPTHGLFYDFLDWQEPRWRDEIARHGMRGRRNAVNQGWTPVYQDIAGDGRYVRLYHECSEDIGKGLTIFGLDNNNQRLRTRNSDGQTWSDGLRLTAQLPYAQSAIYIRSIERVIKDKTQGMMRLYGAVTQGVTTVQSGYIYNTDTNSWVSITALGQPGVEFLNTPGALSPPAGAGQIGFVFNTDTNQLTPIAAKGTPPAAYFFVGSQAFSTAVGGQIYNTDLQTWVPLVAQGTTTPYLSIGGNSAPATNVALEPISEYDPSETNPRFVRQQLHNGRHIAPPGSNGIVAGQEPAHGIVALVKLRQIVPSAPTDIIIIHSLTALKLAMQAVIAGESNEIQTEQGYLLEAVQQLNRELEDWLPLDQIPVDLGELGHANSIGRRRMF